MSPHGADDNVAAQSSRRHQADDNDIVTTRGDVVGTAWRLPTGRLTTSEHHADDDVATRRCTMQRTGGRCCRQHSAATSYHTMTMLSFVGIKDIKSIFFITDNCFHITDKWIGDWTRWNSHARGRENSLQRLSYMQVQPRHDCGVADSDSCGRGHPRLSRYHLGCCDSGMAWTTSRADVSRTDCHFTLYTRHTPRCRTCSLTHATGRQQSTTALSDSTCSSRWSSG